MARTLFRSLDNAAVSQHGSQASGHKYQWLTGLQTMRIGREFLLVNPRVGGWVAVAEDELSAFDLLREPPQGTVGEFLHQAALCTRDGQAKSFDRGTLDSDVLYFFEFAVTTGCNLACPYCFADAQAACSGINATASLGKLLVDRIAEYRAETHATCPFVLEFTGGEPLVNFEVIRETVGYAQARYGELLNTEFVIQTNTTLLTEEAIEFARDNRIGIGISLDGFRAIQDRQRPFASGSGSYGVAKECLNDLRRLYRETVGSVLVVVTASSAEYMPEISLYFFLEGFREVVLRPLLKIGRGATGALEGLKVRSYVEGLFEVLTSVISPLYKEQGELLNERFLGLTFQHLLSPHRPFMCERSPCGGARNICMVYPNGNVYPCNQFFGGDSFSMGSLSDSPFVELLESDVAKKMHARRAEDLEDCRECGYRGWCDSPCALTALEEHGAFMAKSGGCALFRMRYKRALTGLLRGEFDLEVVGKLAGCNSPVRWREVRMKGGDEDGRRLRSLAI